MSLFCTSHVDKHMSVPKYFFKILLISEIGKFGTVQTGKPHALGAP